MNAADILTQLQTTARKVADGKLDPDSAMAVAAIGNVQVGVLRTVVDYLKVTQDQKLTNISSDVFVGVATPALTHDNGSTK